MKRFKALYILAFSVLFGSSAVALAATFPDVPEGHMYQEAVEALVNAQVVGGNPDGTFKPEDPVNRAAMLKMLYLAKGKTPDPLSVRCFPDVEIGSWYESYVCDAAAMRYVNGYSDGTFRPDTPVNRVEALKMIMQVFSIPVSEVTDADRDLVKFVDVSTAAWYTKYLVTAFVKGVLPIPGQEGSRFYPDNVLTRGEAAAYIHNALYVELNEMRSQYEDDDEESSSSSSSSTDESSSQDEDDEGSSSSATSSNSDTINTSFPFEHDGGFSYKQSKSYYFDIDTVQTVDIVAKLQSGQPGKITCRLYLQDESGFSEKYYLGYEEDRQCFIKANLDIGRYQLQVFPSEVHTTFTVEGKSGSGDSNDGFNEAKILTVNAPNEGVLTAVDLEDWYTFSVGSDQVMTVNISNPTELRCIVYAMNDVDLSSFSGPQCNQSYTFPSGTYYVSIGRKAPKGAQQSYTIRLEK